LIELKKPAATHFRNMTTQEQALSGIEKLNVPRSTIPAITHVDDSARIQTVHKETNPRFYNLLAASEKATGCPIRVKTSSNVRGEPIVCTPTDAFRCFMSTEHDILVCGNAMLSKSAQNPALKLDYKTRWTERDV
jgi:carbamoyltransferase